MLFSSQESLLARIQRKQLPTLDIKFNRSCSRQNSKMGSQISSFPTPWSTWLCNSWECEKDGFYSVIRLCYMAQLSLMQVNYPHRPDLTTWLGSQKRKPEIWSRSRIWCTVTSLKMKEAKWQKILWAGSRSWEQAFADSSNKMGSILPLQGAKFC